MFASFSLMSMANATNVMKFQYFTLLLILQVIVNIFTSCYVKRVKVIGIAGNSPETLINSLSTKESFGTILIGNITGSVSDGPVQRESRYKLEFFTITASSSKELSDHLVGFKNSPWWNHMAKLYILDWSSTKIHGCSSAFEMLWAAWRMDLLEVKFLCTHSTKGRLIYSFNPYTSDAPKSWQLETIHQGINNHPWSLLIREYRENNEICNDMDFDKTTDLGGYEIRANITHRSIGSYINSNQTKIDNFLSAYSVIGRTIFRALKATPKFFIRAPKKIPGSVHEKGIGHGFQMDMINRISDIDLTPRYVLSLINSTSISTRIPSSMIIMTRYKGHQSQLSKLMSVIDTNSRIGLCLVLFITLMFLKYYVRQTLSKGVLNILRMICNMTLTDVPTNLTSRIYLSSLFLFMITIQAIYQGKLSSILSKSVPLDNVDTLVDLAESNHMIYGLRMVKVLLNNPGFNKDRSRFVAINEFNCTKYVLSEPLAACIGDKSYLAHDAGRFKLHLSKESILDFDVHWPIRENCPLERRLRMLFTRLAESHLSNYQLEKVMQKELHKIEANDDVNMDHGFQVLTLTDLSFAFIILAIGLGCATISCIVEASVR